MRRAAGPVVHCYSMVVIFGIHAVSEALKSGARSFDYVGIARERHDQRVQRLIEDCHTSGVQVRFLPREELDRTANSNTHQGVIAVTSSKQYADVDTLIEQRHGEYSFLVVLDGIEDPHNLGALIRTADGAGADGVIIPERRAVGLTGTVVKASAGASEHLSIPMLGQVASLNVSVAGAVVMYEVARQRRAAQSQGKAKPSK